MQRQKQLLQFTLIAATGLALSACSGEVIPEDADTPAKAHEMSLTRERQRVIRHDCDGNVTSDKIEQVSSPTDWVTIYPRRSDWTQNKVAGTYFLNKTTNSTPGMIQDKSTFPIHMDNNDISMRVRNGLNELQYEYDFTDGTTEIGTRYLKISYSVITLPGHTDYYPAEEECIK